MEKVFTIFLVVRATVRVVVFVQWQQQRRRRWENFCRRGAPLSHISDRKRGLGICTLRRVRWNIFRHKFPYQGVALEGDSDV